MTFDEIIKDIKENTTQKSFSKKDFKRLFAAFLNTREYEFEKIVTKNGEYVEETVKPVNEFYDFIGKQLKKAGLDTKDVELALNNMKFKASECDFFHDLFSEVMYRYLKTGRRLHLFDRKDISGSISLKEVDEKVKTTKTSSGVVKTRLGAHLVISQKSGCPEYLKERIE